MIHGTHNAEADQRNENIWISINGEFFRRDEAKISVFDSGYLVGDGVWEGIRLHHGVLVFVDDHLRRLWTAAKATGIELPFSKETLIKSIHDTLKKNFEDSAPQIDKNFPSMPSEARTSYHEKKKVRHILTQPH